MAKASRDVPHDQLYRLQVTAHVNAYLPKHGEHSIASIGALVAAFLVRFGHAWSLVPRLHIDQREWHICDFYVLRAHSHMFDTHPGHLEELACAEHLRHEEFIRGFLAGKET